MQIFSMILLNMLVPAFLGHVIGLLLIGYKHGTAPIISPIILSILVVIYCFASPAVFSQLGFYQLRQ